MSSSIEKVAAHAGAKVSKTRRNLAMAACVVCLLLAAAFWLRDWRREKARYLSAHDVLVHAMLVDVNGDGVTREVVRIWGHQMRLKDYDNRIDTAFVDVYDLDAEKVLWEQRAHTFRASALVVDDVALVTGGEIVNSDDRAVYTWVYAFDLSSGQRLWQKRYKDHLPQFLMFDGDNLAVVARYDNGNQSKVFGLEAKSGEQCLSEKLPRIGFPTMFSYIDSERAVDKYYERIHTFRDCEFASEILTEDSPHGPYGLQVGDGGVIAEDWKLTKRPRELAGIHSGRYLLVVDWSSHGDRLTVVDAKSGDPLWTSHTDAEITLKPQHGDVSTIEVSGADWVAYLAFSHQTGKFLFAGDGPAFEAGEGYFSGGVLYDSSGRYVVGDYTEVFLTDWRPIIEKTFSAPLPWADSQR